MAVNTTKLNQNDRKRGCYTFLHLEWIDAFE